MIGAGRRKNRITIERRETTPDANGSLPNDGWRPVATVWGSLEPMTARTLTVASQLGVSTSHTATVLYRRDLLADWPNYRLRVGARVFGIASAVDTRDAHEEISMFVNEFNR